MRAQIVPTLGLLCVLLTLTACGAEDTSPPPLAMPPATEPGPAAQPEAPPEPEPEPEPGMLLRVQLSVGDSFDFEEVSTIDTEGTMQGMDIGSQIVVNANYTYDVVSVDDAGVADVKVTFGRIHGTIQSVMMGEITFDSDSEGEQDPMSAMASGQFLARAGTTFQFMLDPRGEMSDFRGIDEVVGKIAASNPMAAAMQGGEEGIAREFRRQAADQVIRYAEERALPDTPWTMTSELALGPLVMALRHESKLVGDAENGLSIETTTGLEIPEGEDADPMAAQLGLEEFGSSTSAVVGKDDGLPLLVESKQVMRLNPAGQGAMTQTFSRKIERVER